MLGRKHRDARLGTLRVVAQRRRAAADDDAHSVDVRKFGCQSRTDRPPEEGVLYRRTSTDDEGCGEQADEEFSSRH